MIKLENTVLPSADQWKAIIFGARNPLNSWDKSDSGICYTGLRPECSCCEDNQTDRCVNGHVIGLKDYDLMKRLAKAGTDHRKFMRMITVYVDITAPLYWWKEFDTYKVGTVTNSCSTMHNIADKVFTLDDFSHEHLDHLSIELLNDVICKLNANRNEYLEYEHGDDSINTKKDFWWQMIQLLPSSYNQRRTVMLNYEVLANMYRSRKNHKLDEWHTFCDWVKTLPYSELITGEFDEKENKK